MISNRLPALKFHDSILFLEKIVLKKLMNNGSTTILKGKLALTDFYHIAVGSVSDGNLNR